MSPESGTWFREKDMREIKSLKRKGESERSRGTLGQLNDPPAARRYPETQNRRREGRRFGYAVLKNSIT